MGDCCRAHMIIRAALEQELWLNLSFLLRFISLLQALVDKRARWLDTLTSEVSARERTISRCLRHIERLEKQLSSGLTTVWRYLCCVTRLKCSDVSLHVLSLCVCVWIRCLKASQRAAAHPGCVWWAQLHQHWLRPTTGSRVDASATLNFCL